MDRIIRDESANSASSGGINKGINFQKASCTIDASIKIYSNRVDDTWSTSYRILENLNRNDTTSSTKITPPAAGDDDGDEEDERKEDDDNKKKTRRNKRITTHSSTIEKNLNNINLSAQEMAGGSPHADPMFHKMSQVFDEGGAKGMLLTNLVSHSLCLSLSLSLCLSLSVSLSLSSLYPPSHSLSLSLLCRE
jgi:condensin complex subunit 2